MKYRKYYKSCENNEKLPSVEPKQEITMKNVLSYNLHSIVTGDVLFNVGSIATAVSRVQRHVRVFMN